MLQENHKGPRSLKSHLVVFVILCWAVPILIFLTFTIISYRKEIIQKAEMIVEGELTNIASFVDIRIEDAITLCQRPSYEKTWENSWKRYAAKKISRSSYLREVNGSLKGKFYLDSRFKSYAFYIEGEEEPGCYDSRAGIPYSDYMEQIHGDVLKLRAEDSSSTFVKCIDERLWIFRNLYTSTGYEKFGSIVVELNLEEMFKDVSEEYKEQMLICINGADAILDFGREYKNDDSKILESLLENYDMGKSSSITRTSDGIMNGYLYQKKQDTYHIGVLLLQNRRDLYNALYQIYRILALMAILFIPVIAYIVSFFKNEIQRPIDNLLEASEKIQKGNIGTTAKEISDNKEFKELTYSFNSMSEQVKVLFDSVYNEQLARKDAQIQALQAQINPHFFNNTLEMMNWQARLNGDIVVSKMIESLSTVLDYCINRAEVKTIRVSDELKCVDAYLYIMSMRLGKRINIHRDIDEKLFEIKVPPLILQPIVENAFLHGVEAVGSGDIGILIYQKEGKLYLEVTNTGKRLSDKDKDRINKILEGDLNAIPEQSGKHTSIGIRNVNERIHLVYGNEYGLSIYQDEGLVTHSIVRLPIEESR